MTTERMLTRSDAAELCGCSYDTVRRRQEDGDYPHAEMIDGTWYIPVSDLVAAGDLDPTSPLKPAAPATADSGDAAMRIAVLETALERAEAEIEFNRLLLAQLAAGTKAVA